MTLKSIALLSLFMGASLVGAQERPAQWDLNACITYALANNLQLQKARLTYESTQADSRQAKAQLLPSLSASVGQQLNTGLTSSGTATYTGSYGLSSGLMLFDGGKTLNTIKEQDLYEKMANCSILATAKSLQMSLLQTYATILYAEEAVHVYEQTIEKSTYQLERGRALLAAGSLAEPDVALLESQLSTDTYQLVAARNTLAATRLEMKQLLELEPGENMVLVSPKVDEASVLTPLASLTSIYMTALEVMPGIQSSKLGVEAAQLNTASAKAGYLPVLNLNGSLSTGNGSVNQASLTSQLNDGLSAGVGLTLSVPIFSKRQTKTAVEKARLNEQSVRLDLQEAEKSLLKEIESVYQEALSAQSQYLAATNQVKAMQTSYNLIEQQYELGMKNTLDLLTEKNNLLSATQQQMQYKYLSVVAAQVLNLYQDKPVSLQ